ncbi:MAG: LamG domain-containing protein, partial [Phycisphaerales bacterium]
ISAWVRPESFSQNDGRIITKATGTGSNDHFWMLSTISSEGDYVLRFRLKTDDGQDTTTLIAAGGALAVDVWTHAAAIWDGSSMVIYKDGVEVGREVKGGTAVATNPNLAIAIGNHLTGTTGNRAWDGMIDDVRVYNKALTVAELEQVIRGDTARAWGPSPSQGSTPDIVGALPLSWSAGDNATEHDVYFGTDRDAVANADATDTTGIYRGRQAAASFSPDEVEMGGGPYYWRIDEVAADGAITTGSVWRFTVVDYIIVDDFESYNDIPEGEPGSNLVYLTWIDGFDNPNANGSTIGYVTGASMESGEVHGGRLSAPMGYNNTTASLSEVTRTFVSTQDWGSHGVTVLSLWFFGYSSNTSGQLYVKINGVQVDYDGAATDLSVPQWHRWDIDLTTVGTNLQSVTSLAIGVQGFGAIGTLLLDDIVLYRSTP